MAGKEGLATEMARMSAPLLAALLGRETVRMVHDEPAEGADVVARAEKVGKSVKALADGFRMVMSAEADAEKSARALAEAASDPAAPASGPNDEAEMDDQDALAPEDLERRVEQLETRVFRCLGWPRERKGAHPGLKPAGADPGAGDGALDGRAPRPAPA